MIPPYTAMITPNAANPVQPPIPFCPSKLSDLFTVQHEGKTHELPLWQKVAVIITSTAGILLFGIGVLMGLGLSFYFRTKLVEQLTAAAAQPRPITPPVPNVVPPNRPDYFRCFDGPNDGTCKAPLTLVRSPGVTPLKISILYNKRFSPIEPTEPKPSHIAHLEDTEQTSKHTWQVLTQGDGSLALDDGRREKMSMIWWEAIRHGASRSLTADNAACIRREDVANFLEQALRKQGVTAQEMEAFVQYWQTVLTHDYTAASPYLLVRLVDTAHLRDYLPELQVEGDKAKDYTINRFYFHFEPLQHPLADPISSDEYLKGLPTQNLGKRAVIDLGGEMRAPSTWQGQDAFNAAFIRKYIYTC